MSAAIVRIAPSLLSVDFAHLSEQLALIEAGGADWLHIDVMDGCFVPNLTFGVKVIETCRRVTRLPLDVHLMVVEPEKYLDSFAKAGASVLTIHAEAAPHLHRQVAAIRELGCQAGVALNPATSLEAVREVAPDLDLLLIMTVNPGFGGQRYIASMEPKIRELRAFIAAEGLTDAVDIEVDGGIGPATIGAAAGAGANILVAGSALYRDPAGLAHAVTDLRARAEAAYPA